MDGILAEGIGYPDTLDDDFDAVGDGYRLDVATDPYSRSDRRGARRGLLRSAR